jgi:signal transduction histidine kinase
MDGSTSLARIAFVVFLGVVVSVFVVWLPTRLGGSPGPVLAALVGAVTTGVLFARVTTSTPRPPDLAPDLRRRLDSVELRFQASVRVRDAFLARMSHELRTPLNAIVGYAELLSEDLAGPEADDVQHIRSAALHLQALVTTILDLTQLQAGRYAQHPEPVDVASITRSVVDAVRAEADSRGTEVHVDVEPDLVAVLDRRMVQSILFNLVSNACRTTTKGRVTVRATRTSRWVDLSVTDTGIGLTPRQIEAAFRLFDPANDGSARYDGLGLGLAVVREFAEAMGGEAFVDHAPGAGARISVQLPLNAGYSAATESMLDDQITALVR